MIKRTIVIYLYIFCIFGMAFSRTMEKPSCLTCQDFCNHGAAGTRALDPCEPCQCDPILDPYKMTEGAGSVKCPVNTCNTSCTNMSFKFDSNGCKICFCRKT